MVCKRCLHVVRQLLTEAGLQIVSIDLGIAHLISAPTVEQYKVLKPLLEKFGFELIDDPKAVLVEKTKIIILDYVRTDMYPRNHKLSLLLNSALCISYGHLSTLFHTHVGVTIEQFVKLQRVEFAKELLQYGDLTLAEISDRVGYKSQQYLATQFKGVTGLTPNQYRTHTKQRTSLDKVGIKP